MSHLQNKSEIFKASAKLLHDNDYYPAVAHGAYYSCYQLLKHIWLYVMGKTETELDLQIRYANLGSHDFLINQISIYIKSSKKKDCEDNFRNFNKNILSLKKLRHEADYKDSLFDRTKSSNSLLLSTDVINILNKYK